MLNKALFHRFPNLKSLLTRLQYEFISMLNVRRDLLFMNFGYTAHHQGQEPLPLKPEDEIHRYPLQMYYHVAKGVDWTNADALEVSSGRGGGADFIARHFKPRSYTGVDFSWKAIEFCRAHHRLPGLTFVHGNAEDLKFPDESFDIVLNVEASLYYPNLMKFFQHVRRVLRRGGHFVYTDLRYEEKVAEWHSMVEAIGMKVVHREEITENVLKATELDRERRIWLIDHHVPRILRKQFYHMAGLDKDSLESAPHLDKRRYWYFVLQKM
ncbi:MAG: class I SAM-dependent methyltransferase [Anaerolineales bacterium]|nr:class I SAM-dependent methyltransferase [Chloroflexota bacterium]MBK6646897.1 class I SAM-dependent methyltransferase [Anaerolineales bacterium]MCC6985990.1 class I SAM-dependent methyltransferase [Anaerolineales bacterium]